jgi:hypothetical protein
MNMVFKENQSVRLRRSIVAKDAYDSYDVPLDAGREGVVVLVYGPEANPTGYEVEFPVQEAKSFALCSVDPEDLELIG